MFSNNYGSNSKRNVYTIGILGANGGFGLSFLNQLSCMKDKLVLKAVCDVNSEETINKLNLSGYGDKRTRICKSGSDIRSAEKDEILILENAGLMKHCDFNILVEATGNPELSAEISEQCILSGKHVCCVTKESDCIASPYINRLAEKNNVIYTIVRGDQPANLLDLYYWAKENGLDITAMGKSSEYDFVYDINSGILTSLGVDTQVPELNSYWNYTDIGTIEKRNHILSDFVENAPPDYCELSIVSNQTGFLPDSPRLHYPVCKVEELADVFCPSADGGILENGKTVDVFYHLRRPDEASFAGGVFVIISCTGNEEIWQILKEKGHVVSRNGKYACLYLPFHLMGIEAPLSVYNAIERGLSYSGKTFHSVVLGRAQKEFKPGDLLKMEGHHHSIKNVSIEIHRFDSIDSSYIPYYVMANKKAVKTIQKGEIIKFSDIDCESSVLKKMYLSGGFGIND